MREWFWHSNYNFYYYNAGFIFRACFVLVVVLFCFCFVLFCFVLFCFVLLLFFLVIYYLVGAYEGLGRAFYITIYQIQLFFLLNRSYSKLLFWIAPFKFFLFLLLPMSASTYNFFCYLRAVKLSFQNLVNKLLDVSASGPH